MEVLTNLYWYEIPEIWWRVVTKYNTVFVLCLMWSSKSNHSSNSSIITDKIMTNEVDEDDDDVSVDGNCLEPLASLRKCTQRAIPRDRPPSIVKQGTCDDDGDDDDDGVNYDNQNDPLAIHLTLLNLDANYRVFHISQSWCREANLNGIGKTEFPRSEVSE